MPVQFYVLVIVAVLFALWLAQRDPRLRRSSEEHLAVSNGTFDAPARRALRDNSKIARPTPRDLFARGRIYQHWIAENRPEHPAQEAAAHNYTRAVEGFARLTQLDVEDAIILEHIMDFEAQNLGALDARFATPGVRDLLGEVSQQTAEEAAANANNKLEASEITLESAKKHVSDPQNVHDSAVVGDLLKTYNRIRISGSEGARKAAVDRCFREIQDRIHTGQISEGVTGVSADTFEHAAAILDRAMTAGHVSSFNDTEDVILASVWERANAPENRDRREDIREAVIAALKDSWERGGPVCIGGRTARYIGALSGVDADPRVGVVATIHDYKNQIYAETMQIIKRASSVDTPAAQEYAGTLPEGAREPTPAEKTAFAESLKGEIRANIDTYVDKLSSAHLKQITEDCMVYTML